VGIGDDLGSSVPPTKDPPVSNRDELEGTAGVHDEIMLELAQGVFRLESNVDGDALDGIAVAPVLVNGIADVAVEIITGSGEYTDR
jgi:hypothetical protein